jgi:F-type H+-transporting ATPase subunit delta
LIAGSLAKRYAKALVEVAAASGELELEAVREDLAAFARVLGERQDLSRYLGDPAVRRLDKQAAIERLARAMGLRQLATTFLRILEENGRLAALAQILRVYESLVDERLGRAKAVVTAAAALGDEQEAHLRAELGRVTGKEIYLEVRRDPALLGGLIAQVGSQVYDGSLRTQLRRLREQLAHG